MQETIKAHRRNTGGEESGNSRKDNRRPVRISTEKTENCKESYEVNELTELTKALAELITARAKLG